MSAGEEDSQDSLSPDKSEAQPEQGPDASRRAFMALASGLTEGTLLGGGARVLADIYKKSSVDLALRDAFRKMRHFLMTTQGLTEDEAVSLMSVGVDFGITQSWTVTGACTP